MTEAFEATLARIHDRKSVFEGLDERAVEIGVLLPLLEQVGWNIRRITEVYPQHVLPGGSKPDFDLQIGGNSRVVIEVKRWSTDLNEGHEGQLEEYCRLVKPSLAVLTNGRHWHFYLPPVQRKNAKLRRFMELDIATTEPEKAEAKFRRFLARERMSSPTQTVKAARELYNKRQTDAAVMKRLGDAWNALTTDENALADAFTALYHHWDIEATDEQVKKFLAKAGRLTNEVADRPPGNGRVKPSSFTFEAENKEPVTKEVKDFTGVRVGVCKLMHRLHHEEFHKFVDEKPEWFFDSKGQYRRQIGNTRIYVPTGGYREQIKKVCVDILAKFDYPKESLTIELKKS